jgi:hypothetical protein
MSIYQFHDFLKQVVPTPICWIPDIINVINIKV